MQQFTILTGLDIRVWMNMTTDLFTNMGAGGHRNVCVPSWNAFDRSQNYYRLVMWKQTCSPFLNSVISTHTTLHILYTRYVSYDFNLVLTLQEIDIGCVNNLPKPSGHYMYHKVKHSQTLLSAQCIYVVCMDLRTNSDYFPIQH